MPLLDCEGLAIDHTDEGCGPPVILVHSSVSGNRQWRSLAAALAARHRVLAINLHGYGQTPRWDAAVPQPIQAPVRLVAALSRHAGGHVSLVGHSFGGLVAMRAAMHLGDRVRNLVLLEPIPFQLLRQAGRLAAWREAMDLRAHVQRCAAAGDWLAASERFADYWLGDGAWAAMPQKRRDAFMAAIPPNAHEWDAVVDEHATIEGYRAIAARTLVVSDPATRRPVREIVELLRRGCPHWAFHELPGGGHMAPLTRPELVDPVVCRFLASAPAALAA